MDKKRVVLVWVESLLGEGLEHILRGLEEVELIGPWNLEPQVLSRLSQETPDVVLVAGDEGEHEAMASLTARILDQYPDLPVVRIGLEQNTVRVYTTHTLPAHSADLIETIRSLPVLQPRKKRDA